MVKAALIGAGVSLIVMLFSSLLSPICSLFLGVVFGFAVGFLAAQFDTPQTASKCASRGAIAGTIAACGGLLGQAAATIINGMLVGPQTANEVMKQLGLDTPPLTAGQYWISLIGGNMLCSITSLVLMATMGAFGGFSWFQRRKSGSN